MSENKRYVPEPDSMIEVVSRFVPEHMVVATLDDLPDETAIEIGRNVYRRALKKKALRARHGRPAMPTNGPYGE